MATKSNRSASTPASATPRTRNTTRASRKSKGIRKAASYVGHQNENPLHEVLAGVIRKSKGRRATRQQLIEAISNGKLYKTDSPHVGIMVNMTLSKYPKLFKRVERGVWTVVGKS